MFKQSVNNRFKQAMIPATLMGVITNIYIAGIVFYLKAFDVLFSPIASTFLFLIYFLLLKKDYINSKLSFLLVAYTVIIELYIHSYFLGWEMGFYYYIILMPLIFLLNSSWKTWMIIFFNSSIALAVFLLWCFIYNTSPVYQVLEEVATLFSLLNLIATGIIILVIMIYFSRTINKKDEKLIKVNIDLERQNKEIVEQHYKLEILLKEVHHRVKNNLQIISSLMSLQRNTVENEEVITILNESKRRVEAIALIHKKLYQEEDFNRVNFKSYIEELISSQEKISNIKCVVEAEEVTVSLDTAVPLGLIVSEMITNSIKHAFKDVLNPELKIKLSTYKNGFELIIHDNGIGFPEGFDLKKPLSLGTEIVNALTDQIGARIEHENDGGACFKIYFQNL